MKCIRVYEDDPSLMQLYVRIAEIARIPLEFFENPKNLRGKSLDEIAADFANVAGVITDRQMPEMSGFEVIDLIVRSKYVAPPILLVSGGMEEEDHQQLGHLKELYSGKLDFHEKPISLPYVRNWMEQVMKGIF